MKHYARMMCVVAWLVCGADPVAAASLVVSKILIDQGNCIAAMREPGAWPADDDGTKTCRR